MVFVQ